MDTRQELLTTIGQLSDEKLPSLSRDDLEHPGFCTFTELQPFLEHLDEADLVRRSFTTIVTRYEPVDLPFEDSVE